MTISFSEFAPATTIAIDRSDRQGVPPRAPISDSSRGGPYRRFFKRAFDLTAVIVAAPIIVPVIAAFALAVSRDGGKAFYTQQRVGKGGKSFRMWKLRSMVSDADERMAHYLAANPEAQREWDETQKLKNDPRITPIGKLLRRASIDELPQLWNVFTGDMSLVGPRPMMLNQQSLYPGSSYFALRPGITGHWQTSGRNATTFEARAEYDDAYEANLTFMTDMKILVRTVGVVFRCTGY